MKQFRILYFKESVLDHVEEIMAFDMLDAIAKASGKPPDQAAEVWCDGRRVGEIGASPVLGRTVVRAVRSIRGFP